MKKSTSQKQGAETSADISVVTANIKALARLSPELIEQMVGSELLEGLAALKIAAPSTKDKKSKGAESPSAKKARLAEKDRANEFYGVYQMMKDSILELQVEKSSRLVVAAEPDYPFDLDGTTSLENCVAFLKKQEKAVRHSNRLGVGNYVTLGRHYEQLFAWWQKRKSDLGKTWSEVMEMVVGPAGLTTHLRQVRKYRQVYKLTQAFPLFEFVGVSPYAFLEHLPRILSHLEANAAEAEFWRSGFTAAFALPFVKSAGVPRHVNPVSKAVSVRNANILHAYNTKGERHEMAAMKQFKEKEAEAAAFVSSISRLADDGEEEDGEGDVEFTDDGEEDD